MKDIVGNQHQQQQLSKGDFLVFKNNIMAQIEGFNTKVEPMPVLVDVFYPAGTNYAGLKPFKKDTRKKEFWPMTDIVIFIQEGECEIVPHDEAKPNLKTV